MKKGWRPYLHSLFWIGIIAFLSFMYYSSREFNIMAMLVLFVYYVNYLVLIPRLLDKKKYRLYIIALFAAIIVFTSVKLGLAVSFRPYVLVHMSKAISIASFMVSSMITSVFVISLSIILKFTVDWFTNGRIQRDLENQRLTAELALLKSQINPHFLFNSLNSIYSLAYQRSDITPEAILKLSEIMRYMLYECNDAKVDLAKELQYLQNYIDLQKIRFGEQAHIDFRITGIITNQQIVPLLLISFIENAFKHGVANNPEAPIAISITVDDGNLSFYLFNKKHLHNRDAAGGIGLNNVQRRLQLLYPNKYKLAINDAADTYTCQLSLIL